MGFYFRMSECQSVTTSQCHICCGFIALMLIVKNVLMFKQFNSRRFYCTTTILVNLLGGCTFYTTTPSMAFAIIPLSLSLPRNHTIVIQTIIQTHWCQFLHQNTFIETLKCESTVSHILPRSLALSSSMFWYWGIAET